ncbi:MAG: hypothetical protein JSV08_07895 [Acidobacteriota bacterium]|nr:MAG: hypothetical protein JSV08_07895 [Acidobacteriota bacterium]
MSSGKSAKRKRKQAAAARKQAPTRAPWRVSWQLGILLACGLALSLWFLAEAGRTVRFTSYRTQFSGDSLVYSRLATNLARGNGYSAAQKPPYFPHGYRVPTYPLFLGGAYKIAGTRGGFRAAVMVQAFLHFAACLGVGWLAYRLTRSATWGAAAGVAALALLSWRFYADLSIDALAMPLAVAVSVVWLQSLKSPPWGVHLGLGILTILLVYTRPDFLLLVAGIGGLYAWRRQWKFLGGFLGGCALVVVPWVVWNTTAFDRPVLLAPYGKGLALWTGTWTVRGEYYRYEMNETGEWRTVSWPDEVFELDESPREARDALQSYRYEYYGSGVVGAPAPDAVLWQMGIARVRKSPLAWLWHRMQQTTFLFYQEWLFYPGLYARLPSPAPWWTSGANVAISGLLLFLACAGAVHGASRPEVWTVLFPVAGKILTNAPFHTEWRYFFSAYPLVLVLAALGAAALVERVAAKREKDTKEAAG